MALLAPGSSTGILTGEANVFSAARSDLTEHEPPSIVTLRDNN